MDILSHILGALLFAAAGFFAVREMATLRKRQRHRTLRHLIPAPAARWFRINVMCSLLGVLNLSGQWNAARAMMMGILGVLLVVETILVTRDVLRHDVTPRWR